MTRNLKHKCKEKVVKQILTACEKMPLTTLDSLVDLIVKIQNERVQANSSSDGCYILTSENKIKEITQIKITRNTSKRRW